MDLSQLYDPTLDEYAPEALDFLTKFSFDSLEIDFSNPHQDGRRRQPPLKSWLAQTPGLFKSWRTRPTSLLAWAFWTR